MYKYTLVFEFIKRRSSFNVITTATILILYDKSYFVYRVDFKISLLEKRGCVMCITLRGMQQIAYRFYIQVLTAAIKSSLKSQTAVKRRNVCPSNIQTKIHGWG